MEAGAQAKGCKQQRVRVGSLRLGRLHFLIFLINSVQIFFDFLNNIDRVYNLVLELLTVLPDVLDFSIVIMENFLHI